MFHVKQPAILSWGLDYVRWSLAEKELDEVALDHNVRRMGQALLSAFGGQIPEWEQAQRMGYAGAACKGAFWGLSPHQGALFQMSGHLADEVVFPGLLWSNCSRLDIQATLWYEDTAYAATVPSQVACEVHKWAMAKRGRGKPLGVKLIDGFGTGDTAYIGSRNSERFVRVYDKFAESGDETFKGAVRFEVELKDAVASTSLELLLKSPDMGITSAALLAGELYARGVDMGEVSGMENSDKIRLEAKRRDDDTRLAWLQNQVAPTIEKLLATGYSKEKLCAILGL